VEARDIPDWLQLAGEFGPATAYTPRKKTARRKINATSRRF
jgi:hypothetical protein